MAGLRLSSILPNPNRRTLAFIFLTALLCLLSYLLGIYQNSRPSSPPPLPAHRAAADCLLRPLPRPPSAAGAELDFLPRHSAAAALASLPDGDLPPIPFCSPNFTDYCPCQDPNRERRFPMHNLEHRERHCPVPDERVRCRVPRPEGYRTLLPWPASRDRAWFANVPSKKLSIAKADQNWVRVEGNWLVFPGGGTSFSQGVKWYVDQMAKLFPLKSGEIRTVLDIGCGVASFGGHLLDYNILTMSVAPRDVHEAQVQFALERGLPAMLGVLSVHKLPYPSRSFDMAHCARCLIQWAGYDGLYLLEIDRVLRPGGYWVLSGPPINWKRLHKGWQRSPQDLQAEQNAIEDLARRLCWKKVSEKDAIAIWRKPTNHLHCSKKSKILKSPPFCEGTDLDFAWYKKMELCITPLPKVKAAQDVAGGSLEKWPRRLHAAPPRITTGSIEGITVKTFNQDNQIWNQRVVHYEAYFSSLKEGKYRNIMDMNAGLGGFAAAMSKYPVWVMNVVPADATNNTLGIIYERGLIGTYMNWCEAFSTYPRTYDLIHADGLFSMYMNKCDIVDILLEMDRILRPDGAVIIRDHVDVVVKTKRAAEQLRWQSRIVHSENGPFHPEKLLIVDNSIAASAN
ncbi:probable methyltransferase PMT19 [Phoenix dactylifera]|uniref:Methyltransferase n=1 Tax=Phoenix dactylifera TaxID=42345 RepID=A0A8B7CMF8_PHODC|nr:probable methyltransferase PMT19 [Phoenix dactylifera]